MGWESSWISLYLFGSAVLAVGIGLWSLRKRPDPMAWPLALLMFASTLWVTPYAVSLGFTSIDRIVRFQQVRYIGTVMVPVFYLVLTLRYAGYDRWLSRRTFAALWVVPAVNLAVLFTDQSLFWDTVSATQAAGVSTFTPEFGPFYWVHIGYSYLLMVTSLAILGWKVIWSTPLYRKQSGVIFLCGFVPLLGNGAANLGLGPNPQVDVTAMTLAGTGLAFALALFKLDLLELEPVARDHFIEELDDGVVVLDSEGSTRYFNTAADRVLDGLEAGQPAAGVIPISVEAESDERDIDLDGRVFRIRSTTLTDEREQLVGHIIYLNEITSVVEREQRISVLNRILRHNIRNELNVVTSHLEMIGDETGDDAAHVDTALAKTQRVVEFADKARHIEQTLQESDSLSLVSPKPVLERVVTESREQYPDATIEYDAPDSVPSVRVIDPDLLEMALIELVENAVVHTDGTDPVVTIDLTTTDDSIEFRVTDNGPGIPAEETEALVARTETTFEHGSGIGLWLVQWTASVSDGDLSFADSESGGSSVTLSLSAGQSSQASTAA